MRYFFSFLFLIGMPLFGENGVPPFRETPQMEGFFTEDDWDLYQYDVLEDELQRRAEEKGYYDGEPPPRYGYDENLPPQAKAPQRPEEKEDKEKKPCAYPCGNPWLLSGPALLIIGGGIGGGYAAGRHGSWTRDVDVDESSCFPTVEQQVTLEWIPPVFDSLVLTSATVIAELFRPNQELYAQASLTEGGVVPAIPSLGGGGNPSIRGIYTVVFTLTGEDVTMDTGGFLGGIRVNGEEILSKLFPENTTLEEGTQLQVFFSYP